MLTTTHPILQHTLNYMSTKNVTAAELARTTSISPAAISLVLAGKYTGDTDEVLRRLATATSYQTQEWPLLQVPNFKTIQKMCQDAQQNSRMFGIYGETGFGKTTALKYYHSQNPNTYYILSNVLWKQKDFLKAIQKALGSDHIGTIVEMAEDIIQRLLSKRNPLLIIDDIGKIKEHPKCFYLLQLIYDRTEGRCGIITCGTRAYPVYIDKMANKDSMGFRELRRRVSYWESLQSKVDRKFIESICKQFGITLPSAIDLVHKSTANYGDVKELITNYTRYQEVKGPVPEDEQQIVISSLSFRRLAL
jgi:plasmid maintenance system antidote protein VapI